MKKLLPAAPLLFFGLLLLVSASCNRKNNAPSGDTINAINLKRGEIALCGPADKQLGSVDFATSCSQKVKKDFDLAMALLHSFEYDEAEKVFAKIISEEPGCAMAYWGVAMSNYHQLWQNPTMPELEKGTKAIAIAQTLTQKTKRESDYIEAIASFYKDSDKSDHHSRCLLFEQAMEKVYTVYPNDKEAAIFYALALDAAALPTDKSYQKTKKSGRYFEGLISQ